jgi:hypothetical protein
MKTFTLTRTLSGAAKAGALLILGALVGFFQLPASAREVASHFTVSVTLRSDKSADKGLCRSDTGVGAFGATVTVVCATGEVTGLEATGDSMPWRPIHGGAYRFLTHISKDQLSGTIDSYAGVGTSTAFRVVGLPGREYVEMTVGW